MKDLIDAQKGEITEHFVYKNLAKFSEGKNKTILLKIANQEKGHYEFFKTHTKKDFKPNRIVIFWYYLLARWFGLIFALKLMERGETSAQMQYAGFKIRGIEKVINEEAEHEKKLINMLKEEKNDYIGSIVLGLNDALVEITGALAGMVFVLQNSFLIALTGGVTGFAASLSMAASEYLQVKTDGGHKKPFKAAFYTGLAYIIAVVLLVLPFLLISAPWVAMLLTLGVAAVIIFVFSFYVAVVKEISLWKRFLEMILISFGIAFLTYGIGFLLKSYFII